MPEEPFAFLIHSSAKFASVARQLEVYGRAVRRRGNFKPGDLSAPSRLVTKQAEFAANFRSENVFAAP